MPESPQNEVILREILDQSRKAADAAQDCRTDLAVLGRALSDHQDQDARNFAELHDQHRALAKAVGNVRQDVGNLQGHKEAARAEGKKAGRKHGATWAALVTAVVALAQQVWAYFTSGS